MLGPQNRERAKGMQKRTQIIGGLALAACSVVGGAVLNEAAPGFFEGLHLPIRPYALRVGEWFYDTAGDFDGANGLQAKLDFEKCEEGNNTAITSAKSDLRKVKQAYNDCHDQHYEDSMGLAMCAEADRAVDVLCRGSDAPGDVTCVPVKSDGVQEAISGI